MPQHLKEQLSINGKRISIWQRIRLKIDNEGEPDVLREPKGSESNATLPGFDSAQSNSILTKLDSINGQVTAYQKELLRHLQGSTSEHSADRVSAEEDICKEEENEDESLRLADVLSDSQLVYVDNKESLVCEKSEPSISLSPPSSINRKTSRKKKGPRLISMDKSNNDLVRESSTETMDTFPGSPQGDFFKSKIESLRNEVGTSWLKVYSAMQKSSLTDEPPILSRQEQSLNISPKIQTILEDPRGDIPEREEGTAFHVVKDNQQKIFIHVTGTRLTELDQFGRNKESYSLHCLAKLNKVNSNTVHIMFLLNEDEIISFRYSFDHESVLKEFESLLLTELKLNIENRGIDKRLPSWNCVKCNETYTEPRVNGKCGKCQSDLIKFFHTGSLELDGDLLFEEGGFGVAEHIEGEIPQSIEVYATLELFKFDNERLISWNIATSSHSTQFISNRPSFVSKSLSRVSSLISSVGSSNSSPTCAFVLVSNRCLYLFQIRSIFLSEIEDSFDSHKAAAEFNTLKDVIGCYLKLNNPRKVLDCYFSVELKYISKVQVGPNRQFLNILVQDQKISLILKDRKECTDVLNSLTILIQEIHNLSTTEVKVMFDQQCQWMLNERIKELPKCCFSLSMVKKTYSSVQYLLITDKEGILLNSEFDVKNQTDSCPWNDLDFISIKEKEKQFEGKTRTYFNSINYFEIVFHFINHGNWTFHLNSEVSVEDLEENLQAFIQK